MKPIAHFITITKHHNLVMKNCFKVGLFWQGLTHDLSKYSITEFWLGAKYYKGTYSPTQAERETNGYSLAWMHHKGRNRHHFEYWNDIYIPEKQYMPVEMPTKYLVEMVMDRIAASKVYNGSAYTDSDPLNYLLKAGTNNNRMHPVTREKLLVLLTKLSEEGEEKTFHFIKNVVLKGENFLNN